MRKLLVNTPTGAQEIIEVNDGGGYFDLSRVLWDELVDGPLPDLPPGGLVRIDGALMFNQDRQDEHDAAIAETADQVIERLEMAVQRHLDATARQRGYDHMLSLASYAASSHARFAAEGQAGVAWRDNVWQACLDIMADVQAQLRPVPTEAELISELPALVWPT